LGNYNSLSGVAVMVAAISAGAVTGKTILQLNITYQQTHPH
jgi:hypothetical protein